MDQTSPSQAAPAPFLPRWSRILIVGLLLAVCAWMASWFHFARGVEVGYTHVFYIPIVLAGTWWGARGAARVALLLGLALLATHLASGLPENPMVDLFRAVMFMVVGVVVGALQDRRRATQQRLREHAAELERLNVRLSASEKELREMVATRDRFFSIISHDLRGPFTPLLQYADFLARDTGALPREKVAEYAKVIRRSARRLFALAENLLEWSRVQMGSMEHHPETVHLAPLTSSCLEVLQDYAAGKEIGLVNAVPPDAACTVDPSHLERILQNLVTNAIKFTRAGGEVRVSARDDDGKVALEVSDNGVGMQPEDIDRLFRIDTCHSTPGTAQERGSGLGLILCRELAALNGGVIRAASAPGVGSTFTVSLPR